MIDHDFVPFYTGDGGGQLTVCGVRGCTAGIDEHRKPRHEFVPHQQFTQWCVIDGCSWRREDHKALGERD